MHNEAFYLHHNTNAPIIDNVMPSLFKRMIGATEATQKRSVAVPDLTTSPPTWSEFQSSYTVSVDQALSIPEVYAAVRYISTTVSQLSMNVERLGTGIESALVARPDSNRSQSSFFKRTVHNLATTGNAYWRLYRNGDGAVVQIEALAPSRVHVRWNDRGEKFYDYSPEVGKQVTLRNNLPTTNGGQVEHIRLGEFEGHSLGRGPIQVCNASLASILRQREFYERFLEDSKRPSGVYSVDSEMDDEEMDYNLAQIKARNETGEPILLQRGAKYQSIMLNAEQTALVAMRQEASLDVARIFGVLPHTIAAGVPNTSYNYQNLTDAEQAFIRGTLEEYLTAIEDAMSNVLPRGQVAQFDTEQWLRATQITAKETDTAQPVAV